MGVGRGGCVVTGFLGEDGGVSWEVEIGGHRTSFFFPMNKTHMAICHYVSPSRVPSFE